MRPSRALPGVATPFPQTDVVVVRMNTEDLYAGIEYDRDDDAAATLREIVTGTRGIDLPADTGISLKPLSRSGGGEGCASCVRVRARQRAPARDRRAQGDRDARHRRAVPRSVREVAAGYEDVEFDDRLVDNACAKLVMRPQDCDVLVMPMLYGDIVSDVAAGLVGGLGVAPGANVGDEAAVFEAVHGSAPRHAGHNRANPFALMLSGAMLLRHVGEGDAASRLEAAIADGDARRKDAHVRHCARRRPRRRQRWRRRWWSG